MSLCMSFKSQLLLLRLCMIINKHFGHHMKVPEAVPSPFGYELISMVLNVCVLNFPVLDIFMCVDVIDSGATLIVLI